MTFYDTTLQGESVSSVTSTPSVDIGTYRREGRSKYVYAYNGGNHAVWPGDCVVIGTGGTSLTSNYTFQVTNAAAQVGFFAGGVYHATISTAQYGWIVVDGICRTRPDTNEASSAEGIWLAVGVDNGYTSAPATCSTGVRIGVTCNSMITNAGASAASSGKAWIKSRVW